MLDTTTSLRDGGWVVHPSGVASTALIRPFRHHEVQPRSMGSGSEDTYVLPIAYPQAGGDFEDTAGMRIPIGTRIWVHNRSAVSGVAKITTADAALSELLIANCSCCFVLTAAGPSNVGTWRRLGSHQPNAKGPDMPEGFWFELDIRRNQNNVHVLTEAVDAGYDGTQPAIVRVRVRPRVVVGSVSAILKALDMGGDAAVSGINWYAGSLFILTNDGEISGAPGAGGIGGIGGTGASAGGNGGNGGTAIRAPNNLLVYNNGIIQAGGGGGGGGNGTASVAGRHGGAGGGGAGANIQTGGFVRGGVAGASATGTVPAGDGTIRLGGAGGLGTTASGSTGGAGGSGGAPGAAGTGGYNVGNTAIVTSGGAAGSAISRAGSATITFAPGATGVVTGATIVE